MFTRIVVTIGLVLAATAAASAQEVSSTRAWELRIPTGALIGTGAQRDQLKDARMTGLQLSRTLGPRLAITGTFGWARSKDLGSVDATKLDVFTSDVGIETCFQEYFATAPVSLKTFAGFGGGARSYNYRGLDADATNNLAGYVAAGGELGMGRVSLRIEARDYATGFRPLIGGGKSEARNDIVILGTMRFNRRSGEGR